jgi:hypothetical protein
MLRKMTLGTENHTELKFSELLLYVQNKFQVLAGQGGYDLYCFSRLTFSRLIANLSKQNLM